MYVYVYICMYIDIYVCICVCMYVCICVCICMYIYIYVCVYIYIIFDWASLRSDDINIYANNITEKIFSLSKECIPNKQV